MQAQELPVNTAFSTQLPSLQLAWDSTSLGQLKTCPRKYQYSIVEGWQGKHRNFHLSFGLWYHGALERYDHARANGASHDDSLDTALLWALTQTWDSALGRPWFSGDSKKTRFTLIRSIVWYLDQFEDDPIQTVRLANGKPAVELSFRFEGWDISNSITSEPFLLAGHLDRLGTLSGKTYICDRKTTGSTLDQSYFTSFTPDNQFTLYTLAGGIVYGLPVEGLILDAAQIAVTFTRFQREFVFRTPEQLSEWYKDLSFWLGTAQSYAAANYWPQNDKACFRCEFRGICSQSPSQRADWLRRDFERRVWDPLQVRGDI
jgi:Fe-S-cluster formation regulator IscX/YfhJ